MQTKVYIIKCYEFGEVRYLHEAYLSEGKAEKRAEERQNTHESACYVVCLQLDTEV
jgi:hypothetical protein